MDQNHVQTELTCQMDFPYSHWQTAQASTPPEAWARIESDLLWVAHGPRKSPIRCRLCRGCEVRSAWCWYLSLLLDSCVGWRVVRSQKFCPLASESFLLVKNTFQCVGIKMAWLAIELLNVTSYNWPRTVELNWININTIIIGPLRPTLQIGLCKE